MKQRIAQLGGGQSMVKMRCIGATDSQRDDMNTFNSNPKKQSVMMQLLALKLVYVELHRPRGGDDKRAYALEAH